ncbi:hypothetical protein B6V00_03325 [ANME-1 cluster archaeon ex4572_4]|nr:MAG: hypothetical protein B6V00_03325 [ANME-1 cluster archaeon ex4572_4]
MILKTLALRNYRKYKDANLEFPDGVLGIVGLNGVGKTTLVEAVGWALFGHHAARTTKELIKREGASPHEVCSVALEFELEGDSYKVVRKMAGRNLVPKASLVVNGRLETNNPDTVTKVVEERMGMDYKSFFTSVFARQKELNALSSMKAAERKRLVLRMLGIEQVEKGVQAVREDRRGREKKVEGLKAATVDREGRVKAKVLVGEREELEKAKERLLPLLKKTEAAGVAKERELAEAKQELEAATRKYEKFVALSSELTERRSVLENTRERRGEKERELEGLAEKRRRLEGLEGKEEEYFRLGARKEWLDAVREEYRRKQELLKSERKTRQEITRREGKISGLKESVAGFEGVEEAFASQVRLRGELEAAREKYQRKRELERREERTRQEVKERVERTKRLEEAWQGFVALEVEERVEEVKREVEGLKRERERVLSSLGALKSAVAQNEREIEEAREKWQKVAELGPEGECPLCERELGSHYEVLKKKLCAELKTKTERSDLLSEERRQREAELASKEREETLLEKKVRELERGVAKKRELALKKEKEAAELRVWREELERLETDLKPLAGVEFNEGDYKEVVLKLGEFEDRVRQKKDLEQTVRYEEGELERWKKELEQLKRDLTLLREVEFDEREYKGVVSGLKNLEQVYEEIIGLRAEVGRIGEVSGSLGRLSKLEGCVAESVAALERQVAELGFEKTAYEELKARHERRREELSELEKEHLRKKNEFENVCREEERVLDKIEEQRWLLAEKEKEETEIMYFRLLERLMSDFKVHLVGRIRPMLSDYASEMLGKMTDGKYSKLELDENYDVFIYDEGTPYELSRFSGGEEDLANLCLRLAISAVVAERSAIQTNFIILDEIFGSQDALRKRNIITALNELSKKFRQIFLITHIEEVKDFMEHVLQVTEDEAGVSWVGAGRGGA